MVSYDAFEDWARETLNTKERNTDEHSENELYIMYSDGTMANTPMEPDEQPVMSVENLYDDVKSDIDGYSSTDKITLDDLEGAVPDYVCDQWEKDAILE